MISSPLCDRGLYEFSLPMSSAAAGSDRRAIDSIWLAMWFIMFLNFFSPRIDLGGILVSSAENGHSGQRLVLSLEAPIDSRARAKAPNVSGLGLKLLWTRKGSCDSENS